MFEKPKESSQHLKPLYIRGHIDGRPISWMLVDGGAVVYLMLYFVFKKLGREDGKLMKANLTLNGVGGGATRWMPKVSPPGNSVWGASRSLPLSSSSRCEVTIVLFWGTIGLTQIGLVCAFYFASGFDSVNRWYTQMHRLTLL
jgi:hypothetical protein